jgi:2-aminoadipate transaminase
MDMDALEKALKENPGTKFIYTIPTFQNPAGVTLSLGRRKKLLELSEKYDVMILEDNPYFELRYSGEYVPPIKSMDETGRVIYVGSYSKVISPGIRLGFVCAPKEVVSKIVVAKQVSDVHTNQFFMMLVAKLLETRDLDAHIANAREIYRLKRDRMLGALEEKLSGQAQWTRPDGGLFIWLTIPGGRDSAELCRLMSLNKVAVVPGCAFLTDESEPSSSMRLNFSLPDYGQIDRGVEIMARCFDEYAGRK